MTKRQAVFDVLKAVGPLTGQELFALLPEIKRTAIREALLALLQRGVLKRTGRKRGRLLYGVPSGEERPRSDGPGRPRRPRADVEAMAALRAQGLSMAAIGDEYCITRERVRQLLKRHAGG